MLPHFKILLVFLVPWVATTQEHQAPDTNQLCSPETCGDAGRTGVDTGDRRLGRRGRYTPEPSRYPPRSYWFGPEHYNGDVDGFFRSMVAQRIEDPHARLVVPMRHPYNVTERIHATFHRNMARPLSLAMYGLAGGTGLILMSPQLVYMAYVPEELFYGILELFIDFTLKELENGDGKRENWFGLSHHKFHSLWFEADTDVIGVVPKAQDSDDFLYPDHMLELENMIRRVLGVKTEWVGYTPEREGDKWYRDDRFCQRAGGKVLAQYQPSNPSRTLPPLREQARVRVWIEGKLRREIAWEANNLQRLL
ncbi:hypothetical protein CTA1_11335 [Colletotrichum tanaceti]|uniref:Uncharacterized protein n=1 Tax=Colletotrichum tanaceti TaxID=1306861 RepID=A0A4U6X918_9PEZI|nr:hypothetical protein CTA1_11335 [Colletotrichum tanaceti]